MYICKCVYILNMDIKSNLYQIFRLKDFILNKCTHLKKDFSLIREFYQMCSIKYAHPNTRFNTLNTSPISVRNITLTSIPTIEYPWIKL